MVDFITLAKSVFQEKYNYVKLSDDDKEVNLFRFNLKCSIGELVERDGVKRKLLPKCHFFNKYSNYDKATAMDMWNEYFTINNVRDTPKFWWYSNANKTKKDDEIIAIDKTIMEKFDMEYNDLLFIKKYYPNQYKEQIEVINSYSMK